jgi:hypothetical protein
MATDQELHGLMAALGAAIEAHLGDVLRDLGYRGPDLARTESTLVPGVRATFTSPTRQFELRAALPNTDTRALPRHVLLAHLFRLHGDEHDDSLDLGWFAAVHRPNLFDALERLAFAEHTWSAFLRAALPIYATVIQADLRPIVSGESWISGSGDPSIARRFAFLEREQGFAKPEGRMAGTEQTHTYRRGDLRVTIICSGSPEQLLTISTGEAYHAWRIDLDTAAMTLQAHPEVCSGDFGPLRDWIKVG